MIFEVIIVAVRLSILSLTPIISITDHLVLSGDMQLDDAFHMEFSPFAPRAKTNVSLTAEEQIELNRLLSPLLSRMDELGRDMASLKQRAHAKQQEHNVMLTSICKYRRLISSPIRKIPDELLGAIFVHCLPSSHRAPMHCDHAPLLLTQICRKWRDVALSTQQLWASIHIALPPWHSPAPSHMHEDSRSIDNVKIRITKTTEELGRWLSRSGTCLLDISLFREGPPLDSQKAVKSILNLIFAYSRQIRRLELRLPVYGLDLFSDKTRLAFPNLHAALITNTSCLASSVSLRSIPILRAPHLRALLLSNIADNPINAYITWGNLTWLTLKATQVANSPNGDFVWQILSFCKQLRECRLTLPDPDRSGYNVPRIPLSQRGLPLLAHLPFLHTFAVHDSGSNITDHLSKALSLPSLQRVLLSRSCAFLGTMTNVEPFLAQVSNTLTELITNPQMFDAGDFVTILRLCPRLTSLSLGETGQRAVRMSSPTKVDDKFVSLFIYQDQSEGFLCPQLQKFRCDKAAFSDSTLVEFIKRKSSTFGLAALKRVRLRFDRQSQVEMEQDLHNLISGGLKLELTYHEIAPTSSSTCSISSLPPPGPLNILGVP